jgi:membrane protein DedA with SNARE-associated domain
MPWHTFLVLNSLGGMAWTSLYGFGAYLLGDAARRLSGPVGLGLTLLGSAALLLAVVFVKRNETRLMDEARERPNLAAPGTWH